MVSLRSTYRHIIGVAWLACGLLLVSACDNTVDPFARGDRPPFALFGYLDTAADTQFARVTRVRADAKTSDPANDPPRVTTTNLQTNETVVWRDTVVVLDDGSSGLVFFASFDVQPRATYRLVVSESGSEPTRATTMVPGVIGVMVATPRPNVIGNLEQEVLWRDVFRPQNVQLHYAVRVLPAHAETTIVINYGDLGALSSGAWRTNVLLDRDYRIVQNEVEAAYGDTAVVLLGIAMSISVPSDEWFAEEEGSNIENGSGFFGSVGRFTENWSLDSTIAHSIGYLTP